MLNFFEKRFKKKNIETTNPEETNLPTKELENLLNLQTEKTELETVVQPQKNLKSKTDNMPELPECLPYTLCEKRELCASMDKCLLINAQSTALKLKKTWTEQEWQKENSKKKKSQT